MPYDDEISPHAMLAQPSDEISELAHRMIGTCIEIHRELGPGLPEQAYERAIAIEFDLRRIKYARQHRIPVQYKGVVVATVKLDFLIESRLVLEVKSVDSLSPIDRKQVIRYLELTKLPLGLLVNFNVMTLKEGIRRVIRTELLPS